MQFNYGNNLSFWNNTRLFSKVLNIMLKKYYMYKGKYKIKGNFTVKFWENNYIIDRYIFFFYVTTLIFNES
jgi:hypothetical protein